MAVTAFDIVEVRIRVLRTFLLVASAIRLTVEQLLAVLARSFGRWVVGVDVFPERAFQ